MPGEAVSDAGSPGGLVAGLFGKLPAHGDFVERGWPPEVTGALDTWLTAAVAAEREGIDDDTFEARMNAAPLWQGYVAPGLAGPLALHLALAPSIDKAGRYFFLTAGVAGPADLVWSVAAQQPRFGSALETAMYDALGGDLDADAMLGVVADAVDTPDARAAMLGGLALPDGTAWWVGDPADGAPVLVRRASADRALIDLLLSGGEA